MASKLSRYGPAVIAWMLLIGVTGTFYSLVIPGIIKEFRILGIFLTMGESILLIGTIINFFMATVMDPGILPKATEGEEQQQDEFRAPLYKNVEVRGISIRMKWCTTCHFYRPPRCSHCSICDHCIDTFDHHCPWLNNCIGRRNYRQFFIFLILLSLHIVFVFVLCLVYTLKMKNNLLTKENLGSMIVMVLGGMLFVPVIGLTGFHVFLVVTGRTTNEQVTGKFRNGHNPFNKGLCRNIAFICCGPQFPKVTSYIGRQEANDIVALSRDNGGNAAAVEAISPLLNTGAIPSGGGHRQKIVSSTGVLTGDVNLRMLDEDRQPLTGKRLHRTDRFPEEKRLTGGNMVDGRLADDSLVADRSRGSLASRSKSSGGDQPSDEISLSQLGTQDNSGASLSRDSSMVAVRVFPKSGSIGFAHLSRLPDGDTSSELVQSQGSKCNLLDETGSAYGAPGILCSKRGVDSGDTSVDSISYQSQKPQQLDTISSPGNERYQQALREAYSGASVPHKPPIAVRSSTRPLARQDHVQNGPEWSYGIYDQTTPAPRGYNAVGDGVQRFAYVPASSLLESSVVNKSQSMDALGRQATMQQQQQQYSPRQGYPQTPPRLTLAPTLSSSVADYNNYTGYKRPLSFTQAVQLHDSFSRLNNSSRPANARPRSDTDDRSTSQNNSNVNEIRV